MIHIPLLRKGEAYKSLDVVRLPHHRTREPFVEISQANSGLIRRDLLDQQQNRDALAALSTAELLEICVKAADHFINDRLPIGDDAQSPEDYVEQVSATTGLPYALVRKNMKKIHSMLAQMESVLSGLTRGLDLGILDAGFGELNGQALSFYPRTESLGIILAKQLSRRSLAVDTVYRFENASRLEAGQRRTLDSLSHHSSVDSRRVPARSVQLLSGRPCRSR